MDYKHLSQTVAHALRHEPWVYGLELDAAGWVPVEELLAALRSKGKSWRGLGRKDLAAMIEGASKQRFELVGNCIRARYGHSAPGLIERRVVRPPELLFHGTSPDTWEKVRVEGLRPMGRQYVHLTADIAAARSVGERKSSSPVILAIDAAGAAAGGIDFYEGNDEVWLALEVPPEFLSRQQ